VLALHNLLHAMRDNETWLQAEVERQENQAIGGNINENVEQECNTAAK